MGYRIQNGWAWPDQSFPSSPPPNTFLKNSRLALLASCFERLSDSISCGVKGLGPEKKSGLGLGESGLSSSRASWVGSEMVMAHAVIGLAIIATGSALTEETASSGRDDGHVAVSCVIEPAISAPSNSEQPPARRQYKV